MIIPLVDDIKADPFLAQIFIILLLPIVGLIAFLLPFLAVYFLIKHVQKSKAKRLHSAAPKFTNRRQTLRRDLNNKKRKSKNRAYASGLDIERRC